MLIAVIAGAGFIWNLLRAPLRSPAPQPIAERGGLPSTEDTVEKEVGPAIEVIAENLQIPWEIAFLQEGDLLVTERPGTLRRIGKVSKTYAIPGVANVGEGGLLGLALHPKFAENRWLYLYHTVEVGGRFLNRVVRYRLSGDELTERTIIIDGIPGATVHDGGRIAFGPASAPDGASAGKPDYYLYITTGDAGNAGLAQDTRSLAGKILRVRDDGSIPEDNPFGNAVWSYGHRNPQGLAWDEKGRLWSTEHGRSGVLSGLDELNLIEKGKNYGWPVIQGDETRPGVESPVIQSGPKVTWAPAGAAYGNGSIFFGGLRGQALYEAKIVGEREVRLRTHLEKEFGRIRAVRLGSDGLLYMTTSNTDGRGKPRPGDDKIIRVDPRMFGGP